MEGKTELSAQEAEEALRAAYTRPDEATTLRESVEEKCALLSVPGLEVEFDPEEAELCGVFEEDALSAEEALEASQDQIA
jgi:protein traD